MGGRWSSCLKPYLTSRTTKRRLKRIHYNILASRSGFRRSVIIIWYAHFLCIIIIYNSYKIRTLFIYFFFYFFSQLRVESILVRGLKWSKLLDPEKKGQWWLSGDMMSSAITNNNIENYAKKMDKESSEAQKMLQLAAGQRMNTDARRAIFCVIMSGEDYIDAFEKLLRLDLQGKQVSPLLLLLIIMG